MRRKASLVAHVTGGKKTSLDMYMCGLYVCSGVGWGGDHLQSKERGEKLHCHALLPMYLRQEQGGEGQVLQLQWLQQKAAMKCQCMHTCSWCLHVCVCARAAPNN